MRDKDSNNIYQLYTESNANLHKEAGGAGSAWTPKTAPPGSVGDKIPDLTKGPWDKHGYTKKDWDALPANIRKGLEDGTLQHRLQSAPAEWKGGTPGPGPLILRGAKWAPKAWNYLKNLVKPKPKPKLGPGGIGKPSVPKPKPGTPKPGTPKPPKGSGGGGLGTAGGAGVLGYMLGGGDDDGVDDTGYPKTGEDGKNPATMAHHMRGSGQTKGGELPSTGTQSGDAADAGTASAQTPGQVQMLGVQIDKKTAQSLRDQLNRALGSSSGIEKDTPTDADGDGDVDTTAGGQGSVIANRGEVGFDSSKAGA